MFIGFTIRLDGTFTLPREFESVKATKAWIATLKFRHEWAERNLVHTTPAGARRLEVHLQDCLIVVSNSGKLVYRWRPGNAPELVEIENPTTTHNTERTRGISQQHQRSHLLH